VIEPVYIIVALSAYLLGSIPTGYLVGKAKGIDIRTVGSGNIGATNAFRVVGKAAGIFVLIADGLKGYAACAWLLDFLVQVFSIAPEKVEYLRIVAGICAVLGHSFTCWLKFKGGKGVATGAGVFFALNPIATGIALAVWILVVALTRYAAVASIVAAIALAVSVWLTSDGLALRIVATAIGLFVIFKHRSNIRRLLNGTESRIGKKSSTEAAK
jgi:acyl phosphate:glycerol-3-phosphate acyltransferase